MKYSKKQISEAISFWKTRLNESEKLGKHDKIDLGKGKKIDSIDLIEICKERISINLAYLYVNTDGSMIVGYYVVTAQDVAGGTRPTIDTFCLGSDLKILDYTDEKDLIEDYKKDRKDNGPDNLQRWKKYTF